MEFLWIIPFAIICINSCSSRFPHPNVTQLLQNISRNESLISPTIFNGIQVTSCTQVPHQVSIFKFNLGGYDVCSGALVTARSVVTAGHCCTVQGTIRERVFFLLGVGLTNMLEPNSYSQARFTWAKIMPRDYKHNSWINDICVIKVLRPFRMNPCVQPVCVSSDVKNKRMRKILRFSGFGLTGDSLTSANPNLFATNLKIVSNNECSAVVNKKVGDFYTCASGVGLGTGGPNTNPCRGNDGGPLTYNFKVGKACLFGVLSRHTSASCENADPNIFIRVSKYFKFLKRVAGSSMCVCK